MAADAALTVAQWLALAALAGWCVVAWGRVGPHANEHVNDECPVCCAAIRRAVPTLTLADALAARGTT